MLILQNISYSHLNKDTLFSDLNLSVNDREKIALIGNNGTGKTTLLKIIAGELQTSSGQRMVNTNPYYVPQVFGQYNALTVAQALQIDDKIKALREILTGNMTEENYTVLNEDWSIEERCQEALRYWKLHHLDLSRTLKTLSGGEKTKIFLSGISIHNPELILLDEPSNHLDLEGRQLLYDFVQSCESAMIVVSHDKKLLNLLDRTCELSKHGIKTYGGNYDFYAEQKQIENTALNQDIQSKERALRQAKEKERETKERRQRLDNRGKGKQEKAGMARILMNTLRSNAENSTSKLKRAHAEKIESLANDLQELRFSAPDKENMKLDLRNSNLHKGKILVRATDINFAYHSECIWEKVLNFQIISGERIVLKGANGAGKTTLIRIILGDFEPTAGTMFRAINNAIYIDQDYSLLNNALTVYEQAQQFNTFDFPEHDIKMRLNRFLFGKNDWDKSCKALSGGEKIRLILCCLTIQNESPDMIILDEPTNNLDMQSVDILTNAINDYQGTLLVVSHDEVFLRDVGIERELEIRNW